MVPSVNVFEKNSIGLQQNKLDIVETLKMFVNII